MWHGVADVVTEWVQRNCSHCPKQDQASLQPYVAGSRYVSLHLSHIQTSQWAPQLISFLVRLGSMVEDPHGIASNHQVIISLVSRLC